MRYGATLVVIAAAGTLAACYWLRPSGGGGETQADGTRRVVAQDVAVPDGYVVEVVAEGLTFPTGVTFDDDNVPHVVESGYSYGEVWLDPRLLRIENGASSVVAEGEQNGPWNGVAYHDGKFYVAEGGQAKGGRILRIGHDGKTDALVEGLPSQGDHHTDGPAIGPDGAIYFGQGTATNSAVVGPDNHEFGWLKRFPKFHDVPCKDVVLSGQNFKSENVVAGEGEAETGAFKPFGEKSRKGELIKGRVPCSGAVMKIKGGRVELVAWGFRNPFGLAFSPDGKLYVTDNGYDDRGSRPVWGTGDHLWAVKQGGWYGWPDYSGERPLTDKHFDPPGQRSTEFVLAKHPGKVPDAAAYFGVHSSSNGLDFSRSAQFGHVGEAFVAQFGDQTPVTGKTLAPVGFRVVRVDVTNGRIEDFAVNRGDESGPASKVGGGGLERPVAVRFDRTGQALYVVDFGVMLMSEKGPEPKPGTGVLWRITRARP
jgi:glucose/arabinose dehydrogenase